ncbi:MAG TPA: MscL family protein [Acidimicrobiales bacterium]|nr:MscL family protein [Acidimicrobiales bacterium]
MAQRKKSLLGQFKDFVLRGDVVALAVGVVIALAFKSVIDAIVDIVTNVPAIIGKRTQFAALAFHIRGGVFKYGALIQAIISFVIVAAAIFFLVVKPYDALLERMKRGRGDADSDDRPCPECLSSIPKGASRCAYCTAQVTPAT